MCNAYRLIAPVHQAFDEFSQVRLPLKIADPARLPNQPLEMVRPTDVVPILRPVDPRAPEAGVELAMLRWGLIPGFHRGGIKDWKLLCTNARAETATSARPFRDAWRARRCLVPADGFYEWTGPKGVKTRWLFTRPDGDWFAFPGLWERWAGPDGPLETFTLLTTAPGADVEPYHDRQPVILERAQWATWLDLGADPADLLHAGPEGSLKAERSAPATLPGF
jgi:putative SOS response-associated peptidase YedK